MKRVILTVAAFGGLASSALALGNPLVQKAQTIVNQINQGRACTAFTRTQLAAEIDSVRPEYPKRHLLIKYGMVKLRKNYNATTRLTWEHYTNVPLNEAGGKGVFIEDGKVTYYCYGWWKVKDAKLTDKASTTTPGKVMVLATIVLQGAPKWVTTDPAAASLTRPSFTNDPSAFGALNQFDKPVPMSLTKPNLVLVEVDK